METIIWMSMVGVYLLVALCVGVLMLMRKSNGQRRVCKHSLSPLKISLFILIGNCSELKVVSWPQPVFPAQAGIQGADDKQHCG